MKNQLWNPKKWAQIQAGSQFEVKLSKDENFLSLKVFTT